MSSARRQICRKRDGLGDLQEDSQPSRRAYLGRVTAWGGRDILHCAAAEGVKAALRLRSAGDLERHVHTRERLNGPIRSRRIHAMVASPIPIPAKTPLEDPLIHLPCSSVIGFRKGQTIYGRTQASAGLYLVIEGKVKVSRCF